jgi:4-hydroxy 2-oxovalerate aldolase
MPDHKLLDCTLRDGGYYNGWNFDHQLINDYLRAMAALPVDAVELGFRYMPGKYQQFLGGCAYTTDSFIQSFINDAGLLIAVMVNGADLTGYQGGPEEAIELLFSPADQSPVDIVRIAVHVDKVIETLPAVSRLRDLGYKTTINLMQIAGLSTEEIKELAGLVSAYPVDILYFADSLGSMIPDDVDKIVNALRCHWSGELGFHAHNNMELALTNAVRAMDKGVKWVDATVLGMGRGPGNARTEYLAFEFEAYREIDMNHIPLHKLINGYFKPMQQKYQWGPNPFYYMTGKYGIHPTYVQEMLNDSRYKEEDVIAVINHLKGTGGKRFSPDSLKTANNFYAAKPQGTWEPARVLADREVLILGTGPGVAHHRQALEMYIRSKRPYVIALNTQQAIDHELIDIRTACHPVRLLADCAEHVMLPQPLATPASMLPENIIKSLQGKELLDFGIAVKENTFQFEPNYCIVPTSIVIAYTLGLATSGKACRILMAGFDGYGSDDPRSIEMNNLLYGFREVPGVPLILAVTPSQYKIPSASIYAM